MGCSHLNPINVTDEEISWDDESSVSVCISASLRLIMFHVEVYSILPIPHTVLSSTATGHWPGPLQQQRSHKNYADVPDVNMTYFEALQKPADLAVFLLHWPIACICLHACYLHTVKDPSSVSSV